MLNRQRSLFMLLAAALVSVALAACGGDDDGDSGDAGGATETNAATGSGAGGATVSARTIDGAGEVLVDSEGNALYTNDQDDASMIACTGKCASIWIPLAAPAGGEPTVGDPSLEADLGAVERPDGSSQVTYEGMPLYTFVEDGGPGRVTGDGFADSFAGMEFVWTVASEGGKSDTSTSGGSAESEEGGGYGY